jgi:hydroxycarboxylate dehydrogenase B
MADYFSVNTPALHHWVVQLFESAGSSALEAKLTADHLVGANLAGHDSHGVGMAPRYVNSYLNNELQLNQTVAVVADTGSMLVVDGKRGMGPSVAYQTMDLAIERAKQHGVVAVGLRNAHHIGRIGHWAEKTVAAGMISVHFTNALSRPALVAPFGGAEGRFVTNPFTVGIPRPNGDPIVLDFATSALAHGKVRVAHNKKVKVPMGSLIDAKGHPTDNPGVMFPAPGQEDSIGALVTFAEHKGYALAMVCELLGAALTGGETTQPHNYPKQYGIWNNMFTLVLDPNKLGTQSRFESEAASFVDWVKSARLSAAGEAMGGIMMPGDPERKMRAARANLIPIDAGTMSQMDDAAAAVNTRMGSKLAALSTLAVS